MKKADHRFHRDKREQIDANARENKPCLWQDNSPIYIPKRKKKKK